MAVVHHHKGVIFFRQFADAVQSGVVAVHTEYTVGGDHSGLCTGRLFETIFQRLHVPVGIPKTGRFTQADPIDNRGMI